MTEDGYSVKEIVDITRREQTEGFARLETMLAGKADKADVHELASRLDRHDQRIGTLEVARQIDDTQRARANDRFGHRWVIIGALAGVAAGVGTLAYVVVATVH